MIQQECILTFIQILNGCDSTVTLDLTINKVSSLTVTVTVCDTDLFGMVLHTIQQECILMFTQI